MDCSNVPDPAWDYATLWEWAQRIKNNSEQLLELMKSRESADSATDKCLRHQFKEVELAARNASDLLA